MFATNREDYAKVRINSALARLDDELRKARGRPDGLAAMQAALWEAEGYIVSAERFARGDE